MGPLALVSDGDLIELDVGARKLEFDFLEGTVPTPEPEIH